MELNRPSIGHENMLVEIPVLCHQPGHDLRSDPEILEIRVGQQMRIVDHEESIGDGVAETNQLTTNPPETNE